MVRSQAHALDVLGRKTTLNKCFQVEWQVFVEFFETMEKTVNSGFLKGKIFFVGRGVCACVYVPSLGNA